MEMTKIFRCDGCKAVMEYALDFECPGHTSEKFKMEYWKGHLCYECMYSMRKSIGIVGMLNTS